jgi:hypothetical protein
MADDNRIFVKDAANFIGRGAPRLINRAQKLGTIRFQGIRPGESEPVDIPSNEGGTIVCENSRVVEAGFLTTYLNVTMKVADLERLAQAQDKRGRLAQVAETHASPTLKQAQKETSGAANARNRSPAEIGRAGGKKSGESRRASRKWVPLATTLAQAAYLREPAASNEDIAGEIADKWNLREVNYPGPKTLSRFVSELRASGQLPQKSAKRRK